MTKYIAFHNDPALQSRMLAAVDEHVKHDQVVQATYGVGIGEQFRGCCRCCCLSAFRGKTHRHDQSKMIRTYKTGARDVIVMPADSRLVITTSKARLWCVYEHWATLEVGKPPTLVYVNACPLSEVYDMFDARKNTEWVRMFGDDSQVQVRIIATAYTFHEARQHAFDHIKLQTEIPICNARGISMGNQARRIRCNNGRIYANQKIAADALGLQASSISRHLRGDTNMVGGYTFEFIK